MGFSTVALAGCGTSGRDCGIGGSLTERLGELVENRRRLRGFQVSGFRFQVERVERVRGF